MITANRKILNDLSSIISSLESEEYSKNLELLDQNSIGNHCRHILDFYDCLLNPSCDYISYDERKRASSIAENKDLALQNIEEILQKFSEVSEDYPLQLKQKFHDSTYTLPTSLYRELVYVLEHSIHHLAIIKLALENELQFSNLPENTGIAFSTIEYAKKNS